MRYHLKKEDLQKILKVESIEQLTFHEMCEIVRKEEGLLQFKPEDIMQVDPRNGDRILYNSARAKRPHDNHGSAVAEGEREINAKPSIISQGKTTSAIDVTDLSEGFTFINMNLFPMLYPELPMMEGMEEATRVPFESTPQRVTGLHLLQWSSSYQDKDWHNMPLEDCCILIERLGILERKLIQRETQGGIRNQFGLPGFVSIIKNYGAKVGGSILHGHQQIAMSSTMPGRMRCLHRFEEEQKERFSAYLLSLNPAELCVKEYESAVLMVPYFMKRPYDMMLMLKDASKKHLFELDEQEVRDLAHGWKDAICAMRLIMPQIGKEVAYNVLSNLGPGAGIHFDFLPYTQETGGFEHLGLFVCQGNPRDCAKQLRMIVEQSGVSDASRDDFSGEPLASK